ncbi:hypothetical protein WJX74_006353 [Apatococcus lobatus]|uniref:DUF3456 domain-containing protein n=1 Tax=Apatococcus lobatus TaxID=904363 RepID=A0AAW1REQ5_9CHLO
MDTTSTPLIAHIRRPVEQPGQHEELALTDRLCGRWTPTQCTPESEGASSRHIPSQATSGQVAPQAHFAQAVDFDRCSACKAISIEMQGRLEKETPKNHLDMRHRLDKEGKRWGKVIDYRLSELRALTILEGLCGGLSHYRLVDGALSGPNGLQVWQKQQQKADAGLEGRALKAHQQAQNELNHFCDKILEDHEDEITSALQERGSPLLAGAEDLLCHQLTSVCKPQEATGHIQDDAYDDGEL